MPTSQNSKFDSAALFLKMKVDLETFTTVKNLKRSEARNKILEVIAGEGSHFKTQDLIEKLQRRFPEVGRATVYRNLPLFIESGLIQEGPSDPAGEILYELTATDHHDHIVCLDCKNIFEYHDHSIEDQQNRVTKKLGFTIRDHRHVIYATCNGLQKRHPLVN